MSDDTKAERHDCCPNALEWLRRLSGGRYMHTGTHWYLVSPHSGTPVISVKHCPWCGVVL